MTALERYAIEAGICLALVWGIVTYLEHRGAAKYEKADAVLAVKEETHNVAAEATEKAADTKAEATLEQVPPVDPSSLPALPASLHASCPSQLPKTRPAASGSDYTPEFRATGPAAVVQPNWATFERSDVQSARDADAEIIYLQSRLASQYKLCSGG